MPSGMRALTSAYHQPEERDREDDATESARDDERRDREEEAEQHPQAALLPRRIDLEVDPVRAGAAREAREAPPDEVQEGANVRRVPDVGGEEAVERLRDAAR